MGRKILAVEDDRNISDLIRMYLEKEGFEVTTAFDGGTAVERFREIGPDHSLSGRTWCSLISCCR